MAEYFCKGLLIGLIFGVPAGAIGALTIGRALEKGFAAGFLTGMGSSAADLLYSCVGVFGITVVSDFLSARQTMLQVIGGILILLFGFGAICKKELVTVQDRSKGTLAFCFLSAFTTALVNPVTVFSFMAAFAAFGIHGGARRRTGSSPDCWDFSRNTLLVADSQWHYSTFPGQDNRENLSVAELRVRLSYGGGWHYYADSGNYRQFSTRE